MKRILIVTLILCLTFGVIAVPQKDAAAESSIARVENDSLYALYSEFVNSNPNRTSGSTSERAAALWIAETFESYGYTPYYSEGFVKDFHYLYTSEMAQRSGLSQNVVAMRPSRSNLSQSRIIKSRIIIGAHYDNVFGISAGDTAVESHGAYDNGGSVAVLLWLAYQFKDVDLPFDLIFAAFGAEERGALGSESMVSTMTEDEIENTLLFINLDCIAAGDHLYVYAEDYETVHEEFFLNVSASVGGTLRGAPQNKRLQAFSQLANTPYSHVGQMSDNSSFQNAGINSVLLMRYQWESDLYLGVLESDSHTNVIHTSMDTVADLERMYGKKTVSENLNEVAEIVKSAILNDGFLAMAKQAKAERKNYAFFYSKYTAFGATLIAIGIATLAYFLLMRKYKKEVPETDRSCFGRDEVNDDRVRKGDDSVFGSEFEEKGFRNEKLGDDIFDLGDDSDRRS